MFPRDDKRIFLHPFYHRRRRRPLQEWEHANQIFFKKLTADKGCQYQKVFVGILHANRLIPV